MKENIFENETFSKMMDIFENDIIFENETIFTNMRYFISDPSLFYQKKTFRLNTRRFWEIVEKWKEKK